MSDDDGEAPPPPWQTVVGRVRRHAATIIELAKKRARGDLAITAWAVREWAADPAALREPTPTGVLAREHAARLSVPEFVRRYEGPNAPVLLEGTTEGWAAPTAWRPEELYARYRHRRFKVGEDDDGYPVKMKLKYFLRYAATQTDDSPLYVFDSMYDDDKRSCGITADYAPPPYFAEDVFRAVGEHRRPPYRWFLFGPARSGTGVHVDPLATSAWNALISGSKRWVLFPPDVPRDVVRPKAWRQAGEDDEAIDYFVTLLPRLRAARPDVAARMVEFVQRPGETVFVPGGWWHAVLNLEDSVAITQNYCSAANWDRVWPAVRAGRRGMARKLLRVLRTERPELSARADVLNAAVDWDAAAEAARHAARVVATRARREQRRARRAAAAAAAAARGDDSDASKSASSVSSSSDSDSDSSGSVTSASSRGSAAAAAAAPSESVNANQPGGHRRDDVQVTVTGRGMTVTGGGCAPRSPAARRRPRPDAATVSAAAAEHGRPGAKRAEASRSRGSGSSSSG